MRSTERDRSICPPLAETATRLKAIRSPSRFSRWVTEAVLQVGEEQPQEAACLGPPHPLCVLLSCLLAAALGRELLGQLVGGPARAADRGRRVGPLPGDRAGSVTSGAQAAGPGRLPPWSRRSAT